ncbi:MAG: MFS transporter [Desulfatibacillum sp.]|nr:MFS transporter [Desulfatibacillum sp.]
MRKEPKQSPFSLLNVRLFVAFGVFFNARFYYPVFSILFLDFGLTLSQFAILNAIWAATIVLCEVPSGALADAFGRKRLLVLAGTLMVLEMALLAFCPRGNPDLLFVVFALNRIFSGVAEASASGADEAIAYDTLKKYGDPNDWGLVMDWRIRFKSVGFIFAMLIGGMVYDPSMVQKIAHWIGSDMVITRDVTLRFPIYLTLVMALITLAITLMMQEVAIEDGKKARVAAPSVRDAFAITFRAGRWILRTPFVLIVILTGLVFDSVARMIVTMASQYYRLIEIPEAAFGLIWAGIAVMGFFIPRLARYLSENRSPVFNLGFMTVAVLAGVTGMSFFVPWWGVLPAMILFANMNILDFFLSFYINRATRSDRRATVLSFKGLALNLGYGAIGILYSLLLARLRTGISGAQPGLDELALKNAVFMDSMVYFVWYFLAGLFALLILGAWLLRGSDEHKQIAQG